jgi:CheY-like chemotaxis protein
MMNAPKIIAVVDDEAAIRKAIVRLLGANGFITRDYPSAEAFLGCQMARESACLVLDINLGGMSGIVSSFRADRHDRQGNTARQRDPVASICLRAEIDSDQCRTPIYRVTLYLSTISMRQGLTYQQEIGVRGTPQSTGGFGA